MSAWTDTSRNDKLLIAMMVSKVIGLPLNKSHALAGKIVNNFHGVKWAACNLVWLNYRIENPVEGRSVSCYHAKLGYLDWLCNYDIGQTPSACGGDSIPCDDGKTITEWAAAIDVKPGKKKEWHGLATMKQALKSAIDNL